MKNNTSMGITKIPMSTNGFHGVSLAKLSTGSFAVDRFRNGYI
jgi:hypothetical protein